jgi:hypothetical protein
LATVASATIRPVNDANRAARRHPFMRSLRTLNLSLLAPARCPNAIGHCRFFPGSCLHKF